MSFFPLLVLVEVQVLTESLRECYSADASASFIKRSEVQSK